MKVLVPILCIVYALSVVVFGKIFGGIVAKKTLDEVYEKHFKQLVKDGGGQWVGIQEVEEGDDLILFNSPKTGSTLAVKAGACTSDAVAMRLALHEDKWNTCTARSLASQTSPSSL